MFKSMKTKDLIKFEQDIKEKLARTKNCPVAVRKIHYMAKAELLGRVLKRK